MTRNRLWAAATVLLVISALRTHGQEPTVQDGDRVVFYGDSITAQRLYTRFVEDFVLTRLPHIHVTFWNAGVPGDTVYGGYTGDMPARLKRDVSPHQPTVITIMLGMNDGYYMAFNQKYLEVYEQGYRKLLDALRTGTAAPRVTLISPNPYDEVTHGTEFSGYNDVVGRHAAFVKELAGSAHYAFSDFNLAETSLLDAGIRKDKSLASLLVPDRIHPGEASHWVMAATLARSWGISPVVSSLEIDATGATPIASENTQTADFKMQGETLQWTQTDQALPLPLSLDDGMIKFALSISDLAAMDRQMLQVKGLTAKRYSLSIDDRKVASFTREELGSGVNLALYSTPMEDQAKGVDGIERKRAELDEARFILAIEEPGVTGTQDLTHAIQLKDDALEDEQRKAAQPKPHRFMLKPE